MARKRVWIVGTVSWDTVVYVDTFPKAGGFAQSNNRIERLGGSAANIAQGVATAGVETGLITFLGNDELGTRIATLLRESEIKHLEILNVEDNSSHALVVVDGPGDRTVIALSNNYLSQLSLRSIDLQSQDIVVFPLWRPTFLENLNYAREIGCYTVVGLEAIADPRLPKANLAIGSVSELSDNSNVPEYLDRFDRIVVTSGAQGARLFCRSGVVDQPAIATDVFDTTGAGDSFFAGFLAALARGDSTGVPGMKAGALWSAAMVAQYRSIPPHASEVAGLMNVLDSFE